MWLGELFVELGFQPVPALNCREALQLAGDLDLDIAVLLMNPRQRGSRPMLARLLEAKPDLRIILIRDSSGPSTTNMPHHWSLERPSRSPVSRPEWLAKIRAILADKAIGHNA